MKAIVIVKTYKNKPTMLSACSHILREHGHPTDKDKIPSFIKIADFRSYLQREPQSTDNPKLYKELQNKERELLKKIGVYKKREATYHEAGKQSLADKQAAKIAELQDELLKTKEGLNKFYKFTKTAAKKSTVKYVEFVFTWTQTPPTDTNAKEITDAAMEFLGALDKDLYGGVVAASTHMDQSSIHTHVVTELDSKWADILKSINLNPREAYATINERWSEFCKERFKHYDFGDHVGGNKYLKLDAFKKLSVLEPPLSPITKMKINNLANTNERISSENRALKHKLNFIIIMKQTPMIIKRVVDLKQFQKLKQFLKNITKPINKPKINGSKLLSDTLNRLSKSMGVSKPAVFDMSRRMPS